MSLFDVLDPPLARAADPDTSHDAAAKVSPSQRDLVMLTLQAMERAHPGRGATASEVHRQMVLDMGDRAPTENVIAGRLSDLSAKRKGADQVGAVAYIGEMCRRPSVRTGRPQIVWWLSDEGKRWTP